MNAHPPAPDDVSLMLAIAQRDETAFSLLYDRMSGPVFGLILRILRSRAEAEEILQEAFWQVWTRAPDYRRDLGTPFSWVVTIARRKAIDRLRANARHVERIADAQRATTDADFFGATSADQADASEAGRAVRAALAELDLHERRAIALAFFDGLSHAEIAKALQTPVGTIKARIRRGMAKLKAPLASLRPAHNL